jgi:hypothetical protein
MPVTKKNFHFLLNDPCLFRSSGLARGSSPPLWHPQITIILHGGKREVIDEIILQVPQNYRKTQGVSDEMTGTVASLIIIRFFSF